MKQISLVLILCISLFACKKEKFSTNSEWLLPVAKTELTIENVLPDSLLNINSDKTVDVVYQESYGISDLNDFFEVPDRVESVEVTLESLVLEDRSFIDTITLKEIYPLSVLLDGQTQILPAQDITTDEGTEIDVTEEFFTTAKFKEGWIDIVLTNGLPVEAELVEFELVNADDDEIILSGVIQNLSPNSKDSSSYDLAGKTVDGLLEMRVKRVKTAASPSPVLINVEDGLIINFTVRDLKPESATAIFPAQTLLDRADETEYEFGGARLSRIEVESGDILMKVSSSIEEAIILDYRIPQSSKSGTPGFIQKQWTIPAAPKGQTIEVEERFPIDDFVIVLKGEDLNNPPYTNHIYNVLQARIEYSGIERTLSLSDKISIEFGLVDVKPYLVQGFMGQHSFELNDTLDVPLLKNAHGGLSLEEASFNMHIENGFGIGVQLDASNIQSVNTRENKTVILKSPQELDNPILVATATNNGGDFQLGVYDLTLDNSNSNFKLFLENLPDQIIPNIDLLVRPDGSYNLDDFAFNFSDLKADLELVIPMHLNADSLQLVSSQPFEISENVQNQVKSIQLKVLGDNSFPIAASLQADLLDDAGNVILTLFENENNTFEAAELDPTSQRTVGSIESVITADLSGDKYDLLQQAKNIEFRAIFNTDGAVRTKIYSDYKLDLKLIADFIYD